MKERFPIEYLIDFYSADHYPGSGIKKAEFMSKKRMHEIISEGKRSIDSNVVDKSISLAFYLDNTTRDMTLSKIYENRNDAIK